MDDAEIQWIESEALEEARDWVGRQPDRGARRSFGAPRLEGVYPDTVLVVPLLLHGAAGRLDWTIWTKPTDGEPYCSTGDLMTDIMLGILEVP